MKLPIPGPVWRERIRIAAPWVSLATGAWSAFFVVRRYEQAKRVAWLLGTIWIVLGLLALVRWALRRDDRRWMRIAETSLTWIGQGASQEILFFVLPFWIRSTTWTSRNAPFTVLLLLLCGTVVVVPVFNWFLRDIRAAAIHNSLVQFAALAFLVPTLSGTHTLESLALAGALAGGISAMASRFRRPWVTVPVGLFAGASLAVAAAPWIAPVPLRIEGGIFCSGVSGRVPSDTLARARRGRELWAYTPVFAPSGLRDTLVHTWSRDGRAFAEVRLPLQGGRAKGFRVWSSSSVAASESGTASVETSTGGGQLVGRMTISVQ
ncbi:MAG TPA: DUF5924 family protein [Fibrobacteria bacterium]|nr:DUF5924 family protein [Fibrobacteria bacterium]